ncbi:hypothetical protein [Natronomonas sp.]|uniref:hypothetical protein n=1 Tax=Natronomonas sp. TaxID=2184060 RepID=UPI002FC30FE2
MNDKSSDARSPSGRTIDEFGTTRRAVLAASGTVALTGLAGCAALDGLLDRAGEQLIGTTVSAPAAFYAGRSTSGASASVAGATRNNDGTTFLSTAGTALSHGDGDEPHLFRTGPGEIRTVPATASAEGREIELEGWSISAPTRAQDYNSSRSNKPSTEWWAGPDDDIDDADSDADGILDVELELLGHVMTAQDAVERRATADAKRALEGFINATTKALRPALDKCGTGVCETVRANSEIREQGVRRANDAVDDGNWTIAVKELAGVEEIVLGDIERLDDVLVERQPGRPRFIDIIRYMRDEPTIGERFTVCLPDAKLPGDRGSLAEEITLDRVLAYFAPSREPEGIRAPFHDRYGTGGIEYDDEGCVRLDGPISLHEDIACQTILSARLDTYRTGNRAIVGYGTEGGAVLSSAPASADTIGKRVFAATDDVTGEIILGEDRDMVMPGNPNDDGSAGQTLVCPVAVTPEDCPCPLPGLFYVRRCIHDEQVIFAGGWILDEGALYEDSVTLLFDEGPTEVASVTPEDVRSGDFDDRVVEQFSRSRSQHGAAVGSAQVRRTDMNKAELIESMASQAFQTDQGRKGLNAVNVKVVGERANGGDGDGDSTHMSVTALDAPLVHLADASGTGNDVKFKAGAELSKSVN